MANSANATYSVGASGQSTGPAFTGQIMVQNLGDPEARYFKGTATLATGDNSTATLTVNFIDGTQTIPYTPSGVLVTRTGGTGATTIFPAAVTSITNTGFVITFNGTLTANSFIVSWMAWK